MSSHGRGEAFRVPNALGESVRQGESLARKVLVVGDALATTEMFFTSKDTQSVKLRRRSRA